MKPRTIFTALLLSAMVAPSAAIAQDTTRAVVTAPITLDDAIRIAMAKNSAVRLARNDISLDSLAVWTQRGQFVPNLTGNTSASQDFGAGSSGGNPYSMSLGVSSGITLYNGRQNVNALQEARLQLQATGFALGRTQQTAVFVVASDFLALVTQQEQLRVQQENLTAQEEELSQLDAFVRQGTRPIGDLYQQQAAVASTRLAIANARRAVELAKVDLIDELVLDPRGTYTFVAPALVADTTNTPAFDLDSLITIALLNRSDLQAAQYRVEVAERELAIASAGKTPVVSASGGYNSAYSTGGDGNIFSQLNQRRGGSIGVGVSIPIFDRGATSIDRQRAQILLENQLLALRDQGQAVALEVRRAYLNYVAAQEQLVAAVAQQSAASLSLQAAQARYTVGAATRVEVTLARATLVEAQSAVVNAQSSLSFQRELMAYYTGVFGPASINGR